MLTRADRLSFRDCRFLSNQDTLYLNSSDAEVVNRVHLSHCYIEGDQATGGALPAGPYLGDWRPER